MIKDAWLWFKWLFPWHRRYVKRRVEDAIEDLGKAAWDHLEAVSEAMNGNDTEKIT